MFIIRTALINAGLFTEGFKGFGDFSQPQVRLAAIGLFSYCVIKLAYGLFTDDRSENALPSLPTVILTVLACCQFVL